MEKPFEMTALLEEMKGHGLELAEESAKVAVKAVFAWIEKSVLMTENKYDDFFVMAKPQIEAAIMPVIEKINPEG